MQLVKAEDYGVSKQKETEVLEIVNPYMDKLIKNQTEFEQIITAGNTPANAENAATLRKSIKKDIRIPLEKQLNAYSADIRNTAKFLSTFKKNATEACKEKEAKLQEIEDYAEAERKKLAHRLEVERKQVVTNLGGEPQDGLGQLSENMFNLMVTGLKADKEKREAEAKRYDMIQPLLSYIDSSVDYLTISETEFITLVDNATKKRVEEEKAEEAARMKAQEDERRTSLVKSKEQYALNYLDAVDYCNLSKEKFDAYLSKIDAINSRIIAINNINKCHTASEYINLCDNDFLLFRDKVIAEKDRSAKMDIYKEHWDKQSYDLFNMNNAEFDNLIVKLKNLKEKAIKVAQIQKYRRDTLNEYREFWVEEYNTLKMSDDEFNSIISSLKKVKKAVQDREKVAIEYIKDINFKVNSNEYNNLRSDEALEDFKKSIDNRIEANKLAAEKAKRQAISNDIDKMKLLASDLENFKLPDIANPEVAKLKGDVRLLLNKVVKHINDNLIKFKK